jgi:hypothetical protein
MPTTTSMTKDERSDEMRSRHLSMLGRHSCVPKEANLVQSRFSLGRHLLCRVPLSSDPCAKPVAVFIVRFRDPAITFARLVLCQIGVPALPIVIKLVADEPQCIQSLPSISRKFLSDGALGTNPPSKVEFLLQMNGRD